MGVPASLAEGTLEIRKARGEVVGACHWAREVDDPIVDAVTGYSEHAIQHYLVSMQLAGEGEEVESVLPDAPVGSAASKDLQGDALLRDIRTAHMGVGGHGVAGEFDAFGPGAPDDPLLLIDGECLEAGEVVDPALGEDEASPGARFAFGNECRLPRRIAQSGGTV